MHSASHPEHGKENGDSRVNLSNVSNAVAAMHRKFNIPGDVVFKSTADLPDDQRNAIRAMHGHAVEFDLSLVEQGKQLGISDSSLSLVYRGKYGAGIGNITKNMAEFIALQAKRKESRKLPFIVTALAKKIWNVCDLAREFQRIAYLFADAQVGKSEALKEYQTRNNHGSTIYVEVPAGGSIQNFLIKLAEKLKIGTTSRCTDMRRRILESFDDRMLLIVDEAHRAIPGQPGVNRSAIQTIEFIREIFNERKCGVVICATNVFRDAMEQGAVDLVLKQSKRRRLCIMDLGNRPSRADLDTFAAQYKLAPSAGTARVIEEAMIEEEALGMWLLVLRMAAKLANQRKQDMAWDHVIAAHAGLKHMEK